MKLIFLLLFLVSVVIMTPQCNEIVHKPIKIIHFEARLKNNSCFVYTFRLVEN